MNSDLKTTPADRWIINPVNNFISKSTTGGIVLFVSAIVAIVLANSPLSDWYHHIWEHKIGCSFDDTTYLNLSLHHWVNDGLMAIFFFVVGLELKRELIVGELSNPKKALLPIVGALGGMIFPALIYLLFNYGTESSHGWGIPMATDIAFALGVLYLLGDKIPTSLKVFLTALAIVDDLGAVLVIAFFYTAEINFPMLFTGIGFVLFLLCGKAFGIRNTFFYAIIGIFGVWLPFLLSGVHATIAAVLVAFTIPIESLQKLEHKMHPFVSFIVMPIFALANAGVTFSSDVIEQATSVVTIGIILGLIVGKVIGVFGVSALMIKLKLATLPTNVNHRQLFGIGLLASIGFTMSLFVTNLAFDNPEYEVQAKLGIFIASTIGGVLGFILLNKNNKSVNINNLNTNA
ncbi:Na+/H+ antiporter NhaA [Flavobacterium sp. PLA-1-15]|uniref:Na+/H+ antiporter NhaA n=1 Tax=Flavobacterium sp. PLA-1-15 TaxID=3380533 RepID=UPI003B7F6093